MKYNHQALNKKWQDKWHKDNLYHPDIEAKNKFYNLWMFPYPSGEGLHAGHAFASTGSDIYGRYQRMNDFTVFQPIGYDSFGIHAENYSLKIKTHPKKMLSRTTKNYEQQLKSLGHGYDWKRTVTTSDIEYYKWTQWLFVELFKSGLAYRKKASVNWCPSCNTVLADEQVINDECERCGTTVESKELEQWFFRITDYADRLLNNLSKINWSDRVVKAQKNWIGKKEGINITYQVKNSNFKLTCWTSRPDTNFGATFIILAPEHPLALKLTTNEYKSAVSKYIKKSHKISKADRIATQRKKTGVFTGSYAINSLTNREMPIYIADFVLSEVGTGAVVGVPGHDQRDFEFAQEFKLPIIRVVIGSDNDQSEITKANQVQEQEGTMINSDFLNTLDTHTATKKIMEYLENEGIGKRESNYHLRDWLISRQRYWGPPIPMVYCESCATNKISWLTEHKNNLLHSDQSDWEHYGWWFDPNLPIKLPELDDYQPKGQGQSPLSNHPEFYTVTCPHCGSQARRETDVSDTFLDSSWYFLAYPNLDSQEYKTITTSPFNKQITKHWLPVDLYFGGAEHSVLHLMYARFVTQVLYDLKYLTFEEPFPHFFAHGLMIKDGAKMSKSRGNVVNPDHYIEKYGADTLRMYLVFIGPMDSTPDFRDTGIEGMERFINRLWDLFNSELNSSTKDVKHTTKLHQTIKKVTEDIQKFQYNTALSAIMIYINYLKDNPKSVTKESLITLCQLIAPFAPHLAEEVWVNVLNQTYSVHTSTWPNYNPELVKENILEIPVQVNGKHRGTITINQEFVNDQEKVIEMAKADQKVSKYIKNNLKKSIYIKGKLINFVV